MTIRRQLLIAMLLAMLLTTFANLAMGLWSMNSSVSRFVQEAYDGRVQQIKGSAVSLLRGDLSEAEAYAAFSGALQEPITELQILDRLGRTRLLIQAPPLSESRERGMHARMMGRSPDPIVQEQDRVVVMDEGTQIGTLLIRRAGTIHSTESVRMLMQVLFRGSAWAGLLSLGIGVGVAIWSSRRMTIDLRRTAALAGQLDAGELPMVVDSKLTEIKSLQESLFNLATKLKFQQRVRKEKADRLAHEVRTPVMILRGHLESVSDGIGVMDETRIAACLTALDQVTVMTEDIAAVVETQRDEVVIKKEPLEPSAELAKIAESLSHAFKSKGVQLVLDFKAPEPLRIMTDRGLFTQSVYNLLTNACKFTPRGGTVILTLEADSENNQMRLIVTDSGPGIPLEERERIFEPYYRGQGSVFAPGEGLGLHIVRTNMEALGGSVILEAAVPLGARFILTLPL